METQSSVALNIPEIVMGLAGGLALFLYGMDQMTSAMKQVAGSGIKTFLARMTSNRFKAATVGAFVTAVVNSSSVTTVLVVGFISAGLMTLSQSMGIIFGANIGSTVTAQLIAFKLTSYSLLFITVGFLMQTVSGKEKIKYYGTMVLGLGLLFFGMSLMSDSTHPLRSYQPFIDMMKKMDNPMFGILAGAFFTAVIQSSGATTGIVIVLASQGFISLDAGIALAFGANIGTCVTALLASIGKPREAIQASVVHILFNVLGVLIWVGFIDQLAEFVRWFSPQHDELHGLSRLAAESPRQIANAHTAFNVLNTFLFIGFTKPLAALVNYMIPVREETGEKVKLKYLNVTLLETPDIALHHVRLELKRMGNYILTMMDNIPSALIKGSHKDLNQIARLDDGVDALHSGIITYLGILSQKNLTQPQTEELHDLISVTNYFENIGDTVETNMVSLGKARIKNGVQISDSTIHILEPLFNNVYCLTEQAFLSLEDSDKEGLTDIISAKPEIQRMAAEAHNHLTVRLTADKPNRLEAFRIETDIVENLRQIYYYVKRIAKILAEVDIHSEEDFEEMTE